MELLDVERFNLSCTTLHMVVMCTCNYQYGLPWWLIGKESACQCWRCGFSPLGREDSLEKEMATPSSIRAWEIPWIEESNMVAEELETTE